MPYVFACYHLWAYRVHYLTTSANLKLKWQLHMMLQFLWCWFIHVVLNCWSKIGFSISHWNHFKINQIFLGKLLKLFSAFSDVVFNWKNFLTSSFRLIWNIVNCIIICLLYFDKSLFFTFLNDLICHQKHLNELKNKYTSWFEDLFSHYIYAFIIGSSKSYSMHHINDVCGYVDIVLDREFVVVPFVLFVSLTIKQECLTPIYPPIMNIVGDLDTPQLESLQ